MKLYKHKRATDSTQMSYVAIMGIIIAIVAVVMILSFTVRVGASTSSFVPAYARDISNIMENVVSTNADVSTVYRFDDYTKVSYNESKLVVAQGKAITSNKVYIPEDVTVTFLDTSNETQFLLISKVGKQLTVSPIGQFKDTNNNRFVRDVTQDCADEDYTFVVQTDIAELKTLPITYPPTSPNSSVYITTSDYALEEKEMIVYYNPSSVSDALLCKLAKELVIKLKLDPVFVDTTNAPLLHNGDIVFSFSSFPYVETTFLNFFNAISATDKEQATSGDRLG